MNRTLLSVLLALLLGLAAACGTPEHTHVHSGESESASEHPTLAVTAWTDRTELFMEYPAFVAGKLGRSAIHVTDLSDFSPLSEGEAIVTLLGADGSSREFRGGPSRPGIFGVDLKMNLAGTYEMFLRVEAPGVRDLHELGPVTVYPPDAPLPSTGEEEGEISFLKEQQWTLEFETAAAAIRGIQPGVTVPATIEPRAGGDAQLTAPVAGRVEPGLRVPVPGARVRRGEILVQIAPRPGDLRDAGGLRTALVEAELAYKLALQDRDRVERLVQARAIPSRRLEQASAALAASQAQLKAAQERWSRFESLSLAGGRAGGAEIVALKAPFDGVVSEVGFTAGGSVEENDLLIRVLDTTRAQVLGAVPENLSGTLGSVTRAELLLDSQPSLALDKPLATSPVVDPVTRNVAIRFGLDNRGPGLRIGQAARLRLLMGSEENQVAIPETAIVDDGGRQVVFVQTGGESFERRPVRLGSRAEGYVHILEGVVAGERVVHRGAYLVRLAAMSTQIPAHGHVH